jgi:hypothetical protein
VAPQRDRAPPDVSDYVEMQDKLATAEDKARGLESRVSELQSLLEESEVSCVATPFYWLSSCALCLLPRELPAASRIAVHKGPCLEPRCCLHETSASRIPTSLMTCAAGLALAFSLTHTSSLPLALGRRVARASSPSLAPAHH